MNFRKNTFKTSLIKDITKSLNPSNFLNANVVHRNAFYYIWSIWKWSFKFSMSRLWWCISIDFCEWYTFTIGTIQKQTFYIFNKKKAILRKPPLKVISYSVNCFTILCTVIALNWRKSMLWCPIIYSFEELSLSGSTGASQHTCEDSILLNHKMTWIDHLIKLFQVIWCTSLQPRNNQHLFPLLED